MPTYEYECKTCAHTFEAFQAMSDEPLKKCPQCGCAVRRLIHGGTGVIFKGSGFYVTDKGKGGSSSKPAKNSAAAPADSAAAPASPASAPETPAAKETPASGEKSKSAAPNNEK